MYKYICERCGHEFFTKKKEQRFCSKSCANSISTSRRKIFDISIFDKGLNHTTAYILGIIISDGCLSYDEHSHRYRITISMNEHKLVEFLRENYSPSKNFIVIAVQKVIIQLILLLQQTLMI